MRRLLGAAALAFLVLAVAVTPLNAVIAPNEFELRLADPGSSVRANVTLYDETHLVLRLIAVPGTAPGPAPGASRSPTGASRVLHFEWEHGCSDANVAMRFEQIGDRYRLTERTFESCFFGVAYVHEFVLLVYSPIDPASVDIVRVG